MMNSDVEVSGIAAALVSQNGEVSDFYRGVLNSNAAKAKILQLVPGKDEIIEV
jgi:hypothetical protein